jgi:hypothetical protein
MFERNTLRSANLQLETFNLDSKSTGPFARCAAVGYTDPVNSPSLITSLDVYTTDGSQTNAANPNASDTTSDAFQNVWCDVVPQDDEQCYHSYDPYDCRGPK